MLDRVDHIRPFLLTNTDTAKCVDQIYLLMSPQIIGLCGNLTVKNYMGHLGRNETSYFMYRWLELWLLFSARLIWDIVLTN